MIFHGNLLSPEMLFYGFFDIGTTFYCGIISNNHGFPAMNYANSRYNSGSWKFVLIHSVSSQG